MPKTYYLDDNFLNAALRNVSFTPPSAIYVALYVATPTVSGGGVEVTGAGYSRQPVTFGPPSNGQAANTAEVLFPVATNTWGTITSFGLLDAPIAGNLLYFNNLSVARLVQPSDQVRFPAGQIIASEV